MAGIALYYNFKHVKISRLFNAIALVGVAVLFFFYPASGDRIELVVGFNRVIFSLLSVAAVFLFWKMEDREWTRIKEHNG